MEDNTVRVNEIEEIEPETEIDEAAESSNSGAFVAGIIGGFLAYAMIGGAKKAIAFVQTKLAERKQKSAEPTVIEAEIVEPEEEQGGSDEGTPED